MLLLHGVHEEKGEDAVKIVVNVVREHLKTVDFSSACIAAIEWGALHQITNRGLLW